MEVVDNREVVTEGICGVLVLGPNASSRPSDNEVYALIGSSLEVFSTLIKGRGEDEVWLGEEVTVKLKSDEVRVEVGIRLGFMVVYESEESSVVSNGGSTRWEGRRLGDPENVGGGGRVSEVRLLLESVGEGVLVKEG